MSNDNKFTEIDIIKQAILMLKNNLIDMKSYLNNSMSPTLKLQKIKVEILKADDRLNDIYNVLNTDDETRLIEAKKLCNILKDEVQAIVEERKYKEISKQEFEVLNECNKNNTSSNYNVDLDVMNYMDCNPGCTREEAEEALSKLYEEKEKEYAEYCREQELEFEQDSELYGKEYATWHSKNIYGGNPKRISDYEELMRLCGDDEELMKLCGIDKDEIKKQKNYCKYFIKAYKPKFYLDNISKRKLPAEIFKYLFSNGYLKEENIVEYSTNQFGRKFEAKRGDIQTEEDMVDNQKNLHRYNKIDFSKIKNSKFNKILYISTEWDYDSISKFVAYINEKFKGIIFSDENSMLKTVYKF